MITISQSGSFQGTGRTLSLSTQGNLLGANFVLGCNVPFVGGFEIAPDQVLGRVYHGLRQTSKAKELGMHDCYHEKFHGNLRVTPKIEFDVPAHAVSRIDYSLPSTHSIKSPENGLFFRGREARSAKCMWKTYSSAVGSKAPSTQAKVPYCTLPAWCCFSATAPKWETWPNRDYAGTLYEHYSYLGSREDGVVIIGITRISVWEIVFSNGNFDRYQVSASKDVIAYSATGTSLRRATYLKGKWTFPQSPEPVFVSADEAMNIISSGVGFAFQRPPAPDYSVLPKFTSNEVFSGRISVNVHKTSYDRQALEQYLDALHPVVARIDPEFVDNRELHDDLIDSVNHVDINSIAYLADIRRVGDTIRSITKLAKGKVSAKEISSMWLSLRYGDRLTILDSLDLLRAASLISKRSLHLNKYQNVRVRRKRSFSCQRFGRTFSVKTMQASSLYFNDADLGIICDGVRTLMNWDLWPSFKNAWDLIPLSFVVDWFVRVEDLARAIDRRILSQYYDVYAVSDGNKVEVEIPRESLPPGFEGQLIWSRYTRRISNRLTFSPFRCDAGRPSNKNVVDGISLVIQASS